MKCPACKTRDLRPVLTKQGVDVDYCDRCKGVWLDKGEIYLFSKYPKRISEKLTNAFQTSRKIKKLCPRSKTAMVEINYPLGPKIDYSRKSGGLWFDKGELKSLLQVEKDLHIEIDPTQLKPSKIIRRRGQGKGSGARTPGSITRKRHKLIAAKLLPLPNLYLRSAATLLGLYAVLGAVLIACVEFIGISPALALGIGIVFSILQFLLGPWFMDLSLRWMYRLSWVQSNELPRHLTSFIRETCLKNKMAFPRMGIIQDGAPQAFTYGHRPNNARIVISQGLIDLLDPEELEAVVAHEIGHAVHWDMLLMTLAQLVPLILYYIYRVTIRASGGNNKSGAARLAVALGAYLLYIISQYVVLWFSRTREYHADRFSGEATGNPSTLASGLVKIAYGLAGQEKTKTKEGKEEPQSSNLEAIGALGIFNASAARSLALTSYGGKKSSYGQVAMDRVKGAMRWDLWNPWAKWYELNSTHPLVANRLRYLSDQAVQMGLAPYVVFDEVQPESYWDEFLVDFGINMLPTACLVGIPLIFLAPGLTHFLSNPLVYPLTLACFGASLLVRHFFKYKAGFYPIMSVASLLKKVKVSGIRPVPCQVRGTIIGKGVPGYIASEDFVMKDETGIMFLDYRHPFAIWEFFFGLLKANKFQGRMVTVEGWYRRSPMPFIEIRTLRAGKESLVSWIPMLNLFTGIIVLIAGVFWLVSIF